MKVDSYQEITDKIIEMIESGDAPWRKPWKSARKGPARNLTTDKPYRGINRVLLHFAPFDDPRWLTFNQAKAIGGNVRKGEKGTRVVFWKMLDKEDSDGTEVKIPMLRQYVVFNVQQCDIPADNLPELPGAVETTEHERMAQAEELVRPYLSAGPSLAHGGDRAFYRVSADSVTMPELGRFERREEYYSTLYHELIHSTGHPSRLKRLDLTARGHHFGSPEYSKEELVAEFGSAFLCAEVGIAPVTLDNSAAYLRGWLRVLKSDKRMAVQAAAAAEKAVDRILGRYQHHDD